MPTKKYSVSLFKLLNKQYAKLKSNMVYRPRLRTEFNKLLLLRFPNLLFLANNSLRLSHIVIKEGDTVKTVSIQ